MELNPSKELSADWFDHFQVHRRLVLNFELFWVMFFAVVKGTAGVYGEQQQKRTQSCVFVCDNPESQVCFQKIEEAAINKYSCNFPAARGASFLLH